MRKNGQEQYENYVRDVLETGSTSINATIKKNSYHLMSTPLKKIVTGVGKRLKIIKSNADYFLDFADYFLDFFFSAFLRLPRSEGP